LPRLVVVVDEFATLKAELPDFVDALVGIAQRGRSLGVHLVLATQRPAGAVSDHVRANANLRIALRVQDAGDSTDVVDVVDAASLPRHRPGRACVRLGPGEVATVQTALVTAAASGARPPVELRPFVFGPGSSGPPVPQGERAEGPSDLDRLVAACVDAWAATGRPLPRRPWPDPLPRRINPSEFSHLIGAPERPDQMQEPDDGLVAVAVADDPDHQRRVVAGWRPADGNLAVFGVGGSGTTTSLLAVAVALARTRSPQALHLYGLDHGAGELAVLNGLPHCGAVVAAGERERQHRLVRHLRAELERRRSLPSVERRDLPEVVVLVDGAGGFLAGLDDIEGFEILESFERVFADGPEVGIRCAVTADRGAGLRSSLAAVVRQRWVHRLADPLEAGLVGLSGSLPDLPPGRYVDAVTGLVAQVAVPARAWAAEVADVAARWVGDSSESTPPRRIATLPAAVPWSELGATATLGRERPWTVPVGVADDDLSAVALPLWDGDHVLVAGPARAGRTTALATIAEAVLNADPPAVVVALAGRRSWLSRVPRVRTVATVDTLAAVLDDVDGDSRPVFVLVDDAELVDDKDGVLERLVDSGRAGVHVVAAAKADVVRGLYNHWTRAVRRSRLGILLRPNLDLDGDLLGATLPRRTTVPMVPGRGFVVADGVPRLAQFAMCGGSGGQDAQRHPRF
jgi:S-DNA-T family DNA segregation ATPase FtsK/SpoIIIE